MRKKYYELPDSAKTKSEPEELPEKSASKGAKRSVAPATGAVNSGSKRRRSRSPRLDVGPDVASGAVTASAVSNGANDLMLQVLNDSRATISALTQQHSPRWQQAEEQVKEQAKQLTMTQEQLAKANSELQIMKQQQDLSRQLEEMKRSMAVTEMKVTG
jgi:hypothetical protein